jgi:hypothetical protein
MICVRSRADGETCAVVESAILCRCKSRFQSALLAQTRRAAKLCQELCMYFEDFVFAQEKQNAVLVDSLCKLFERALATLQYRLRGLLDPS